MAEPGLLRTFRFNIHLLRSPALAVRNELQTTEPLPLPTGDPLGDGAFAECNGLGAEMEVKDVIEGGRNDGPIRLVGAARYQPLVLRRGMLVSSTGVLNTDLWDWLQGIVAGRRPVVRYDGLVEVLDRDTVQARWIFYRGLPTRIVGPQLNARTGEVAIEEISIAHEGLRLEVPA